MKKILLVFVVLTFISINSYCAKSMAGKKGIGNFDRAVALRYWKTDDMGVDLNFGFSFGKDETFLQLGFFGLPLINKTDNVKFFGLGGIQFNYANEKINNIKISGTSILLGGGIGIEYFFNELPQVGIGAFLSGVGITINNTSIEGGNSDSSFNFSTNPTINLNIRYYFNFKEQTKQK